MHALGERRVGEAAVLLEMAEHGAIDGVHWQIIARKAGLKCETVTICLAGRAHTC